MQTGKVRFVLINFAFTIPSPSSKAAEAVRCAGLQGKLWEMHDLLLSKQTQFPMDDLLARGRALGLDDPDYRGCLEVGRFEPDVKADKAIGIGAGVKSTPTLSLGVTDPGNPRLAVSTVILGAKPYAEFKQAIDKLLASL